MNPFTPKNPSALDEALSALRYVGKPSDMPLKGETRLYASNRSHVRELLVGGMLNIHDVREFGSTWSYGYKDYPFPGYCHVRGCPQRRQVNGSLLCRYHADVLES